MTSDTVLLCADVAETRSKQGVWTILVGGGSGARYGTKKQYELLAGERVIDRSRRIAESVSEGVVVVVPEEDAERESAVAGGATRTESVRAGLAHVPTSASIVLVHDVARPLASADLFRRVIDAVAAPTDKSREERAVIPAVAVTDTIKVVEQGAVVSSPDRTGLVAAQTPQGFHAGLLRRAYSSGAEATDDAALVALTGTAVAVVEGETTNIKITDPVDLEVAELLLRRGDER
jgi:2-C-methyl-D-erythritol 4-phosphate cytidylyltransferase